MTNQTQNIPSFRPAPQQEQALAWPGLPVTQGVVRVPDDVDGEELRAALDRLVERHEILRTTFVRLPGLRVPQQLVRDALDPAWTAVSGRDAESVTAQEAGALDLENGPVLRAALLELAEGRSLVLTAPAACLDAASLTFLLQELRAPAGGAEEALQYADYAEWRRQLANEDPSRADAARAWWEQSLPLFSQALLFGGAPDAAGRRARFSFIPGEEVRAAIVAAAEGARATVPVFLEACLHALVARVAGEPEPALAGLADGRAQPDLAGAVGPYAQLVPIRSRVDDQTTFVELVDRVARARAEAARHQDFATAQDLAATGAASVAFACHDLSLTGGLSAAGALERLTAFSPTPLALTVDRGPNEALTFELVYDPSAYTEADVSRLAGMYEAILAAAADPSLLVSRLPLLSAAGREEVLALGAGSLAESPGATVRETFEQRAAAVPQALAVTDGTTSLSYVELDAAANRLAHLLGRAGVEPGAAVALFLDRSPDAVVAMLGIIKAGAAFVPLNSEHPALRLEHQLRESQVAAVVTHADLLGRLPDLGIPAVCLDRDAQELSAQPDTGLAHVTKPDDVAYVMYTSGSTGLPKGVAVTHANVAHYTARMLERFGEVDGLRFALVSALSTDLGYTSVFSALGGGGAVVLVPPDVVLDPDAFASFATDTGIDVLKITPSLLGALLAARGSDVLPRQWLVCGGEALTLDLLTSIRAAGGSCRILNHYGPTETTIGTCAFEVTPQADEASRTVPIGRPFTNARAYIVDGHGEPTPVGVVGELLVAGAGVARGYVGRPEETEERFVADPFAPDGTRAYRTGDRARFLPDGNIEFLGRADEQVKIRGYRVEPGEVEAALLRHEAVRGAAVVVQAGEGESRLVAYVVASPGVSAEELRAHLVDRVPEYMLPTIGLVEALPLTPSGKIDRRALAERAPDGGEGGAEHVEPRNDLEREIAAIWQELLGLERVGVTDDFFALGGHSLLATQMITRIRRSYGNVPLRALFNAPTVSGLAEVLGASAPGGRSA